MKWHLICRVGKDDKYLPDIPALTPRLIVEFGENSKSTQVDNNVIEVLSKNGLTTEETSLDLLHLAMTVYTGDLRIERAFAEDSWSREIVLEMPVASVAEWRRSEEKVTRMLSFLTGDKWELRLRERKVSKGALPTKQAKSTKPKRVTLFSGGLDSFAGAIDLLQDCDDVVALVGQYGAGSTNPSQVASWGVLKSAFPDRTVRFGFYVQPARFGAHSDENTMRSRSILFLTLGTLVANACGKATPLSLSENGLISLNVPLTFSRMGSLSTRTTHPYFISLFRELLSGLGIHVSVHLPYRFHTKGEMLAGNRDPKALAEGLAKTLSCARPDAGRFQGRSPGTHCGYCVPCIIRLSSMKAAGFDLKDAAHLDISTAAAAPTTVRGEDSRAFRIAIQRLKSLTPLQVANEVLQSGPIPSEEIGKYVEVYRRGLREVESFLGPGQ